VANNVVNIRFADSFADHGRTMRNDRLAGALVDEESAPEYLLWSLTNAGWSSGVVLCNLQLAGRKGFQGAGLRRGRGSRANRPERQN